MTTETSPCHRPLGPAAAPVQRPITLTARHSGAAPRHRQAPGADRLRAGHALPGDLDGRSARCGPTTRSSANPGCCSRPASRATTASGWNALTEPFTRYLLNSAIVVLGCILGNLVSCSMAAYAFARLEFTGKKCLVRDHAAHDHAADPRGDRAAVHPVLPARLDQHVPAADRAEAPGHRRVLRLPDGAVHPRHPARAGRGRPDRRLRPRRGSSCG